MHDPAPTPLSLLIQHAQWIVAGMVIAVMWDVAQPTGGGPSTFYPDQVVRVRVAATLKDRRGWWRRLRERGSVAVHKPYNARRLAPGDGGIFFLTRNAVPAQGGAPYDLTARQTGYLEVGLSQPYRVGGLYPAWVSNGLYEPLPLARIDDVRAVLRTGQKGNK